MEKVYSVDIGGLPAVLGKNVRLGALPGLVLREGVVHEVLGQGHYSIALEGGSKVQARGSTALKPGDKVQVLSPEPPQGTGGQVEEEAPPLLDSGLMWSALMPLAFGGPKANAELEVHVEKRSKEPFKKNGPVVYFVFIVKTEGQGEIQWGIHLNGRQVALQVYAPQWGHQKEKIRSLAGQVEKALVGRGFVMSGQVIFSGHPLRRPSDTRLNLRG
jgi:hypothetical protein